MDTNEIGFLLGIMAPVFPAIAGCCIAIKKKRNGVLWFFVCLLSGLLGLIVVACSKSLDYEKDLGEKAKESDTLGGIMLLVSIIWLGFTFYWGWNAAKSYHDQMFWNFHMQLMNR